MIKESPPEEEGTPERVLREMKEKQALNEREIEGIRRQFPTISPPKKYKDRLDELVKENTDLKRWIEGMERQQTD